MSQAEGSSRRLSLLLAAGLLAGCGSAPPAATTAACGAVAGEEALTSGVVLVGDLHGTREIPAAFAALVCQAAAAHPGRTVLAGLEIPAGEQPAIDTFLAAADGVAATRALLGEDFWRRDYQDGRSSEAMLALLRDLRRLRRAGLRIAVRGIDPGRYDAPAERDAGMAATLAAAIAGVRPAQTLILVGNVHTRTLHGYPWDPRADYAPLGAVLRARGDDLLALDVKSQGGSAWTCTSAEPRDCGAHELRRRDPEGPTPRIGLDPAAAPQTGYDGVLFVGPVTASAPACPSR